MKRLPNLPPSQTKLSVQDVSTFSGSDGVSMENEEMRRIQMSVNSIIDRVDGLAAQQPATTAPTTTIVTGGGDTGGGTGGGTNKGKDGKDGKTPVKGVDYFDGKDGEKGEKGDPGADGKDASGGGGDGCGMSWFFHNEIDPKGKTGLYLDKSTVPPTPWTNTFRKLARYNSTECLSPRVGGIGCTFSNNGGILLVEKTAHGLHEGDAIVFIEVTPDTPGTSVGIYTEQTYYMNNAADVDAFQLDNGIDGIPIPFSATGTGQYVVMDINIPGNVFKTTLAANQTFDSNDPEGDGEMLWQTLDNGDKVAAAFISDPEEMISRIDSGNWGAYYTSEYMSDRKTPKLGFKIYKYNDQYDTKEFLFTMIEPDNNKIQDGTSKTLGSASMVWYKGLLASWSWHVCNSIEFYDRERLLVECWGYGKAGDFCELHIEHIAKFFDIEGTWRNMYFEHRRCDAHLHIPIGDPRPWFKIVTIQPAQEVGPYTFEYFLNGTIDPDPSYYFPYPGYYEVSVEVTVEEWFDDTVLSNTTIPQNMWLTGGSNVGGDYRTLMLSAHHFEPASGSDQEFWNTHLQGTAILNYSDLRRFGNFVLHIDLPNAEATYPSKVLGGTMYFKYLGEREGKFGEF